MTRIVSYLSVFFLGMFYSSEFNFNKPISFLSWAGIILLFLVTISILRYRPEEEKGVWKVWKNKNHSNGN